MVAELHKLGYESLRAAPYLAPSGCAWRCCVVPASLTRRDHGARLVDGVDYETLPRYTSADQAVYFGWRNLKRPTPLTMAKRFLAEFPEIAQQGKRPDPGYVAWFTTMLELTAPIGVPFAYGDWEAPKDRMETSFCDEGVVVRLPPVDLGQCGILSRKTSSNINDINRLFSTGL